MDISTFFRVVILKISENFAILQYDFSKMFLSPHLNSKIVPHEFPKSIPSRTSNL